MFGVLRTARELAQYADDVRWAVRIGWDWFESMRPAPASGREIELIEKFRDIRPLEHDEVIWSTECEFDIQEWQLIFPPPPLPLCEPPGMSCAP